MEWLNKLNNAIDYIEVNITSDVDYAQAAVMACCSLRRFQNMFLFITDVTPAEYVRRRRMALSADELINSKIKIIDLSHKYRYESPEAFTRSFKAFHGISPSDARKYRKYIDYPRLSFEIKIKGGHYAMNDTKMEIYKNILVKMEIIELTETLKFAGLTNENLENFKNIGIYHQKYKSIMAGRHTPYTEIGLSSNICPKSSYAFGCQVDSIDALPEGLVGLDTGLTKFACLTFRVQPGADLLGDDDGGGDGMITASEYLDKVWIPKNMGLLHDPNMAHGQCEVFKKDIPYQKTNLPEADLTASYRLTSWIEVYKNINMDEEPEMCFYLPLANGNDAKTKSSPVRSLTATEIKAMQVAPEPIFGVYTWRVLDKQDGKALLLSENVIASMPYHHTKGKVTWEKCSLRDYLNGEFYNSFNDADKARIILTKELNNKNPWYNAATGKATDDYIFCLSINDVIKYFGDSGDFDKRNGWWWVGNKNKGYDFEFTDGGGQFLIDQHCENRIAKNMDGSPVDWVLRSPGRANTFCVGIQSDGMFYPLTGGGVQDVRGIRPAMWVDLML